MTRGTIDAEDTVHLVQSRSSANVDQQQHDRRSSWAQIRIPLEAYKNLQDADWKLITMRAKAMGIFAVVAILISGVLYLAAIGIAKSNFNLDAESLRQNEVLLGAFSIGVGFVWTVLIAFLWWSALLIALSMKHHSACGTSYRVETWYTHWQSEVWATIIAFGMLLVLGILVAGVLYLAAIGIVKTNYNFNAGRLSIIQFVLGIISITAGLFSAVSTGSLFSMAWLLGFNTKNQSAHGTSDTVLRGDEIV